MKTKPPEFRPMTRDEVRETLAGNLRRLFEERGLSARSLAKTTGLCYRSLQRIVYGHSDPSASLIINVSNALNVTVESLFARPESAPPRKSAKA